MGTYWLFINNLNDFNNFANTIYGMGELEAIQYFLWKWHAKGLSPDDSVSDSEKAFLDILGQEKAGLKLMKEKNDGNHTTLELGKANVTGNDIITKNDCSKK